MAFKTIKGDRPGETIMELDDKFLIQTSRGWAADVLEKVSQNCDIGHYPRDVDPFDLGRALGRALSNCRHENAHQKVVAGMLHYQKTREWQEKENGKEEERREGS